MERCGKINAVNSCSDNCTGIGVVAGFTVVVLIREGPHVKHGYARWRIELHQRLQEVRGNCKTRNHLGLNVSNEQIAHELAVNGSDVQQMTTQLRAGIVKKTRRLSEKEPVYQSIVAVRQMKGDNEFSLLSSLLSRSHAETNDERALQENVSALGAPALPPGDS
jgi:hypothetical protein